MADQHYAPGSDTPNGASLRSALHQRENGITAMVDHRDTIIQMFDGDGSDPSHFVTVKESYGFASNEDARGFFLELDSYLAKVRTNDSVSGVLAAEDQLFARAR